MPSTNPNQAKVELMETNNHEKSTMENIRTNNLETTKVSPTQNLNKYYWAFLPLVLTIIGNIFTNNYVSVFAENATLGGFTAHDNKHNINAIPNLGGPFLKRPYLGQAAMLSSYQPYAAYWFENVSSKVDIGKNIKASLDALYPEPNSWADRNWSFGQLAIWPFT